MKNSEKIPEKLTIMHSPSSSIQKPKSGTETSTYLSSLFSGGHQPIKQLSSLSMAAFRQESTSTKSLLQLDSASKQNTPHHYSNSTAREPTLTQSSQLLTESAKPLPLIAQSERKKILIQNNNSTISYLVQRSKKSINNGNSLIKLNNTTTTNNSNSIQNASQMNNNNINMNSSSSNIHNISNNSHGINFSSQESQFLPLHSTLAGHAQNQEQLPSYTSTKIESVSLQTNRERAISPNVQITSFIASPLGSNENGSILQNLAWKQFSSNSGKKERIFDSLSRQLKMNISSKTSGRNELPSPSTSMSLTKTNGSYFFNPRKSERLDRFAFSQASSSNIAPVSVRKIVQMQDFFTNRVPSLTLKTHGDFQSQQQISSGEMIQDKNSTSLAQICTDDVTKQLHQEIPSTFTCASRSNLQNIEKNMKLLLQKQQYLLKQFTWYKIMFFEGRADLKALIKWFEKIKRQNEADNKYDIGERRKKQLEIINACFRELCCQIKSDFSEREQFFRMAWEENINYYRGFIEDFDSMHLKITINADSEYNRIHELYKQYIRTTDMQTQQAKEAKILSDKQNEASKKELQESMLEQKKLKQELNSFKKICMFLKKKLAAAMKENTSLNERQTDRARYSKQQLIADICKDLPMNEPGKVQITQETFEKLMGQLKVANEAVMQKTQNNNDHKEQQTQEKEPSEMEEELDGDGVDDSHFVFEYDDESDVVQDMEQLNAVIVNTEQEVPKGCIETQVNDSLRESYMYENEAQTDLILIESKYDPIMYDNETMDDIFDFYAYKQQMDSAGDLDSKNILNQLNMESQEHDKNLKIQQRKKNVEGIEEVPSDSNDSKDSSSSSNSSHQSSRSSSKERDTNDKMKNKSENYDKPSNFKKRQSIRERLSVTQNLFNSNRHLALQLEQYLGNAFVNEFLFNLSERFSLPGNEVGQSPHSESHATGNVNANKRMSFLASRDTNPFYQKKRIEIKEKLQEILDPEKVKKILDDAGLKVTTIQTETQLEKFLKIYQLTQLKSQDLSNQLENSKSMLGQISQDLDQYRQNLESSQTHTAEQEIEIATLQETVRKLQSEIELKDIREKEILAKYASEEEEEQNQKNGGVTNKHKNQPRIFRPVKKIAAIAAFQLGKKVNLEWEFQKQSNSGKTIVEKAKGKKMAKFHNYMTVKTLLKQITMLYNERLNQTKENASFKDIEFGNFIYNYYSSQYGVKKIADQKFLILVLSVKKYSQILRVNVFSKFIQLQEGTLNYSNEDLNKYIDVLDFVNNISQAGTNYVNSEAEQKYVIPYIKAVHYISQFGDSRMKPEENAELRRDVEALKWLDANKIPIVDFDSYMTRLLTTYRTLVNRAKQYVINAFNACDLDGNRKCNLQEWSLLIRHIEPEKFDDDQLVSVFEENADIIEQDEEGNADKNLSFDKFAVVSLEYELFSDESQDRYLDVQNQTQLKEKFQQVISVWQGRKPEFIKRFTSLENIDQAAKDEWFTIISVLDEKLEAAKTTNANIKPLLIAYNILDKESALLEQDNLEQILHRSHSLIPEPSKI